jgi:uncharacterized protein YjbI with pentapeptide repeats
MPGKFLVSSVFIMLLSVSLGCLQSDQERIQEIMKQKQLYDDQSRPQADPPGQMLAGRRLKKEKLKGANLRAAMLAGTDLREADLEDADLTIAMLLGANLSRAKLVNANFEGAMMLGVNLENANINGAMFKNAAFLTQDQIDDACGTPKFLPDPLKAPKDGSCEQRTIKPE